MCAAAQKTIEWNDVLIPFQPTSYFQTLQQQTMESLTTKLDSPLEEEEAQRLGYKSICILHSKYEKVNVDQATAQQKHLTRPQRQQLASLLSKYTNLFSGKLGKHPHQKLHLELKWNITLYTCCPYPVPKQHEQIFKDELT